MNVLLIDIINIVKYIYKHNLCFLSSPFIEKFCANCAQEMLNLIQ